MTDGLINRLTREEIAQREIGRTEITPWLSWMMTGCFIATLVLPPLIQFVHECATKNPPQTPSALQLFKVLPTVAVDFQRAPGPFTDRILAANRRLINGITNYEQQLEEHSLLRKCLLGPVQSQLTGVTGLGNEKVYLGREGWLFYRPDVDYLTGPGFLQTEQLRRRTLHHAPDSPVIQADPRPAIIDFHRQLARSNIHLIVMPIPAKPAIVPGHLSSRFDRSTDLPLQNLSYQQFIADLEQAGVNVFDPSLLLTPRHFSPRHDEPYLKTDTHWTPAAVNHVADALAKRITRTGRLKPNSAVSYQQRLQTVENLGDIAQLLRLPRDQRLFPREKIQVRQIIEPDGVLWKPDPDGEILLLGDSFTNIYSLAQMHWGTGAGLAEQLSFQLQRPINRLAQNDGGAHAVRQALQYELARGQISLDQTRIVIWQFAMRELAAGDWKVLDLPLARPSPAPPTNAVRPSESEGVVVRGTVRAVTHAPPPGSVPYRDAVIAVHLEQVRGRAGDDSHPEIVVYLWGLKDNQIMAADGLTPGQEVTLRLVEWSTVREKFERFNRIELDDPDFKLIELPAYWGELVK